MNDALLKSVSMLIRQPVGFELADSLLFDGLNSLQKNTIESLKNDEELNKYGNEQAEGRWDDLWKRLPNLFRFIDNGALYDFWQVVYEPSAIRISSDHNGKNEYSRQFLECIKNNLNHHVFQEYSVWLKDLLSFEDAVLDMCKASVDQISGKSLVFTKKPFRALKQEFNIAKAVEASKNDKNQPTNVRPDKETQYLLFVRNELQHEPDLYCIEENVYKYLQDPTTSKISESQLNDLKEVGLLN